jgi:ComF family protein
MLTRLLSLVVPPTCLACRRPAATGQPLCGACRRALPWLRHPCARCGLPAPASHCCPAVAAAWDGAWAPLAYEGPARALVGALKFRGALVVADAMAAQIAAGAPGGLLTPGEVLVPVPTHPRRARRRGFDQGRRLAIALGRRTGLPVAPCLVRRGAASRQLGASRRERLQAGRIDLAVQGPPPARAVLVDDVHTTGATLAACALALRGAGSTEVWAVTYARAIG